MKTYRRFIRIKKRLIPSPKFRRKSDADDWYHQMLKKKHYDRHGLDYSPDDSGVTVIEYSRKFLAEREKAGYPPSTTKSDEQRLRDYILPSLAEKPIALVSPADVRALLTRISKVGYRKRDFKISAKTRAKVQVLLSTIFSEALNEEPPLVKSNPCLGIKLKEAREGTADPVYIANREDCLKFLKAAKEIGPRHFVLASTVMMSGVRKQELIAARWRSLDPKARTLTISEKYIQADNSIVPGTKAGKRVVRPIPIPAELVAILSDFRTTSAWRLPEHFILCRESDGRHLFARDVSNMIEAIREKAGVFSTTHGLRHTYGREFVLSTGNTKALQAILGHSVSATTDLYSNLGSDRVAGFGESVSFDLGVKKSEG